MAKTFKKTGHVNGVIFGVEWRGGGIIKRGKKETEVCQKGVVRMICDRTRKDGENDEKTGGG